MCRSYPALQLQSGSCSRLLCSPVSPLHCVCIACVGGSRQQCGRAKAAVDRQTTPTSQREQHNACSRRLYLPPLSTYKRPLTVHGHHAATVLPVQAVSPPQSGPKRLRHRHQELIPCLRSPLSCRCSSSLGPSKPSSAHKTSAYSE